MGKFGTDVCESFHEHLDFFPGNKGNWGGWNSKLCFSRHFDIDSSVTYLGSVASAKLYDRAYSSYGAATW